MAPTQPKSFSDLSAMFHEFNSNHNENEASSQWRLTVEEGDHVELYLNSPAWNVAACCRSDEAVDPFGFCWSCVETSFWLVQPWASLANQAQHAKEWTPQRVFARMEATAYTRPDTPAPDSLIAIVAKFNAREHRRTGREAAAAGWLAWRAATIRSSPFGRWLQRGSFQRQPALLQPPPTFYRSLRRRSQLHRDDMIPMTVVFTLQLNDKKKQVTRRSSFFSPSLKNRAVNFYRSRQIISSKRSPWIYSDVAVNHYTK